MKNFCRFLLITALFSSATVELSIPTQAAPKAAPAKKAGKGKNKRTKLIEYYESMMGRKLTEAQKVQLRNAAAAREAAQKKFRTDVAKLFGTTPQAMATRERAYKKAHPAKPKR